MSHTNPNGLRTVVAVLRPRWIGGTRGYLYDVILDGETIVSKSNSPGHDACRALFGRGRIGKLLLTDETGSPWISFDILRSALLIVSEEDLRGLRVRRYRKAPAIGAEAEREGDKPQSGIEVSANPIAADARGPRYWERDDDYPHVALQLGDEWRIVGCRDDLQWIFQHRSGLNWKSSAYCRSKDGLRAMLRRNGLDAALVDAFPVRYPERNRPAVGSVSAPLVPDDPDSGLENPARAL